MMSGPAVPLIVSLPLVPAITKRRVACIIDEPEVGLYQSVRSGQPHREIVGLDDSVVVRIGVDDRVAADERVIERREAVIRAAQRRAERGHGARSAKAELHLWEGLEPQHEQVPAGDAGALEIGHRVLEAVTSN